MLELYSTNQIPLCQIGLRPITCHFLVNNLHLIMYSNSILQPHWKKKSCGIKFYWLQIFLVILLRFEYLAPRHFIFAKMYLDNRDNRPQNTCVSSDKLGFLFLLWWSNTIFSSVWRLCSFPVTKMKILGTQSAPSQPTQPKKITLACYTCLYFFQR